MVASVLVGSVLFYAVGSIGGGDRCTDEDCGAFGAGLMALLPAAVSEKGLELLIGGSCWSVRYSFRSFILEVKMAQSFGQSYVG